MSIGEEKRRRKLRKSFGERKCHCGRQTHKHNCEDRARGERSRFDGWTIPVAYSQLPRSICWLVYSSGVEGGVGGGGQEEELDVCSLILDAAKATETFWIQGSFIPGETGYEAQLVYDKVGGRYGGRRHNLCLMRVRWGVCRVGGGHNLCLMRGEAYPVSETHKH